MRRMQNPVLRLSILAWGSHAIRRGVGIGMNAGRCCHREASNFAAALALAAWKALPRIALLGILVSACGGGSKPPPNSAPVASFTATPISGPVPLTVLVDAAASSDRDGSIASYAWNFGDETPAEFGMATSHTYVATGTFSITLTVVDNRGTTATSSDLVSVRDSSWSQAASMSMDRADTTASPLPDGRVLVAGGSVTRPGRDTLYLTSAEIYDPATDTWSPAASMPGQRADHTATLLPNGRLLVAGGYWFNEPMPFNFLIDVELYDPATDTWSPAASMNEARAGHTATMLPSGKVMVAGGRATDGRAMVSPPPPGVELYDPVTNTWSQAAGMAHIRAGHTATLLQSGAVLVVGGTDTAGAELYDPGTNEWSSTGSVAEARKGHTATLLPSGKVLVAGGRVVQIVSEPAQWASTEIYDPVTNTWSQAADMVQPRVEHTATLLPNGNVLVAGGAGGGDTPFNQTTTFLASAEIYDPATDTWSLADSMTNARSAAEAVPIPGGRVLVIGGRGQLTSLSSCEIFR